MQDGESVELAHEVDNPEEELKKVNEAIRRYEVVLKSSSDYDRQTRVRAKLRSLRSFRAKLLQGFDVPEDAAPLQPPSGVAPRSPTARISRIFMRILL